MNESTIEFVDIYDVWYQPWWKATWWYVVCAVITCAIILFVVYFLYRRGWFFKKLSCEQRALKSLDLLTAAQYDSSKKIYAAYFQATLILKKYFAERYSLNLIDKTDVEILEIVKDFMQPTLQSLLVEFMQRAFRIKFARDQVSEQMLLDDITFIKKIIEETSKDFDKAGRS